MKWLLSKSVLQSLCAMRPQLQRQSQLCQENSMWGAGLQPSPPSSEESLTIRPRILRQKKTSRNVSCPFRTGKVVEGHFQNSGSQGNAGRQLATLTLILFTMLWIIHWGGNSRWNFNLLVGWHFKRTNGEMGAEEWGWEPETMGNSKWLENLNPGNRSCYSKLKVCRKGSAVAF